MNNPFKDINEFMHEINGFLSGYNINSYNHAKRISDYFEISVYNSVVQYYRNNNFVACAKNIVNNVFRYKLSPAGNPKNFSYFIVSKKYIRNNKIFEFEIHHNIAIESARSQSIFVTPDVSVIDVNSISNTNDFYISGRNYSSVKNRNLITFFESKNLNPFPELLFNFIGIINEIHTKSFYSTNVMKDPLHLAPSLMLSGSSNIHTSKIKMELEMRYQINIFCSLFYLKSQPYSRRRKRKVCRIGS